MSTTETPPQPARSARSRPWSNMTEAVLPGPCLQQTPAPLGQSAPEDALHALTAAQAALADPQAAPVARPIKPLAALWADVVARWWAEVERSVDGFVHDRFVSVGGLKVRKPGSVADVLNAARFTWSRVRGSQNASAVDAGEGETRRLMLERLVDLDRLERRLIELCAAADRALDVCVQRIAFEGGFEDQPVEVITAQVLEAAQAGGRVGARRLQRQAGAVAAALTDGAPAGLLDLAAIRRIFRQQIGYFAPCWEALVQAGQPWSTEGLADRMRAGLKAGYIEMSKTDGLATALACAETEARDTLALIQGLRCEQPTSA